MLRAGKLELLYDSRHRATGVTRMGLRDDKKRQTRIAILEGALARFREEGFATTRVRDITQELQISEATFFNYFPSKQSVLEEAAEELLERSMLRLEESVHREDPVPDRLDDLMKDFVADFSNDRQLAALLGAHTTFFSGSGSERLERARQLLSDMFATGQRRGEIRADVPSSQLGQLFVELMLAMIRTWVDEPDDSRPLAERLSVALSILLRGCVVVAAEPVAQPIGTIDLEDQLSPTL
jgi:AcrR family transcriptional regulator